MFVALAVTAALAAEPPEPPSSEDLRLVRQARQLRTVGATCAVAAPPVIFVGLALAFQGDSDGIPELKLAGVAVGAAGGLAALVGVPLLVGSGAVSRHAIAQRGGAGPGVALPVTAGALFVGSGALFVGWGFEGPAWPAWTSAGLYVGGVTLAWVDANRAVRRADARSVGLAPWLGPNGTRGVVLRGTLR